MRDATGRYNCALVLGGTSDLGQATVERLIADGTRRVILAGRRPDALATVAASLRNPTVTVDTALFQGDDASTHSVALDALWPASDVDIAIVAYGEQGDEHDMARNPEAAARLLATNLGGTASALLELINRMTAQGHGTIVVFSSVAGQRVRANLAVYGASKAGLDGLCQGLSDRLVGTGVNLMIVRPGFVPTKLTAGLEPAPFATTADKVANDIAKGLASGADVVWSPGILRFVSFAMKHLPKSVWRKVSAR